MKKIYKEKWFIMIAALAVGLFVGYLVWHEGAPEHQGETLSHDHQEGVWTCSMHPQIRQSEPGKCPICGMDLILLEANSVEDEGAVILSPEAVRLANIKTMKVGAQSTAQHAVKLNGIIVPNEKNVSVLTAHFAGRIERLLVNTEGEKINRGQVLTSIYSPELISAQQELLQASAIRDAQPALYQAAVQKLKNFKFSERQIEQMIKSGNVRQTLDVYADKSGTVLKKHVEPGDHVNSGQVLYTLTDLNSLWVEFDAYSTDLQWLKDGQEVNFTVSSVPGRKFTGKISFIEPVASRASGTVKVRVMVTNKDQVLKPGMYVSGEVQVKKDADDIGLVVPKTAVLWTGERSVVYVKKDAGGQPAYALRMVTLGAEVDDSYLIREGLASGDEVVINGAFTVDAAAQLAGKESMMNQAPKPETAEHKHSRPDPIKIGEAAIKQLQKLLDQYLLLKDNLVAADYAKSRDAIKGIQLSMEAITPQTLGVKGEEFWYIYESKLSAVLSSMDNTQDLAQLRNEFVELSRLMVDVVQVLGPIQKTIYVQYCPMANNDKGANWLSDNEKIKNPYFGDMMLTCGEVTDSIK